MLDVSLLPEILIPFCIDSSPFWCSWSSWSFIIFLLEIFILFTLWLILFRNCLLFWLLFGLFFGLFGCLLFSINESFELSRLFLELVSICLDTMLHLFAIFFLFLFILSCFIQISFQFRFLICDFLQLPFHLGEFSFSDFQILVWLRYHTFACCHLLEHFFGLLSNCGEVLLKLHHVLFCLFDSSLVALDLLSELRDVALAIFQSLLVFGHLLFDFL